MTSRRTPIPTRPASPSRKAARRVRGRRTARADAARPRRSLAGRLHRAVVILLLALLWVPLALILVHRFVPVPITPLMIIRLVEGEGLRKDWVALEDIAPALPRAVIAAEDNLFCEHFGFDWEALSDQIETLLGGGRPRGASTITMQTAKNLFLWPERSLLRKALEAWFTPQIELLWDKRRILEVYLNIVEFGPGIYGAEAAARAHFGKAASALGAHEAALLAAILPSPREWSPRGGYAQERATTIRRRIEQLGPRLDCAG